jgi:hypothetical protein
MLTQRCSIRVKHSARRRLATRQQLIDEETSEPVAPEVSRKSFVGERGNL